MYTDYVITYIALVGITRGTWQGGVFTLLLYMLITFEFELWHNDLMDKKKSNADSGQLVT